MYATVVMTGGISLFSPINIFGRKTRESSTFLFERQNPALPEGVPEKEALERWLQEMEKLLDGTRNNPKNVSAEYSMLYALKQQGLLKEEPEVVIIHTATLGGRAAALLLQKIFKRDFNARVVLEEVGELDVSSRIKLNRSLGEFMQVLGGILRSRDPFTTCFAPIGGYKVMTSFGYIVGSFFGFKTAYLHEDNQVLHQIPPLPVAIDQDFIRKNEGLLRRLLREQTVEWSGLNSDQQQAIEDNSFFFERIREGSEELISLNAFGYFICHDPRYAPWLQSRVKLSRKAMETLKQYPDAEKFIYQQICQLIYLHKNDPYRRQGELKHEAAFSTLTGKKLLFSLFKGASNGRYVFRAAWRYEEKEDSYYINYLWLNHSLYERQAAEGVGLLKDYSAYTDISEKIYE